ncbi:MAG: phosphatidylserine/phosphatidylglycerophosphate/cardiolipin synthase family protein [Opitutaceae bacterium]|nr:phosphatidylserine/phosphatidylglycerophosphate/cardiolipin synthase family protein [Opitutaceae bacterium]
MSTPQGPEGFGWLGSGRALLGAQLEAIDQARGSVRLETYIFAPDETGAGFRTALTAAAQRGVEVDVLMDAFGSLATPEDFFDPLIWAGGRVKRFNAAHPGRFALRDHRKLLLVDDTLAFVGGCNLANEYAGDGIIQGWRDGGVSLRGPLLPVLVGEFAAQWARADAGEWRLSPGGYARAGGADSRVRALCLKPGFGPSALRSALREDLARARDIAITTAYFLPSRRLLRQLMLADRRGARVRILLAGPSDVPLMSLASRSLYRALICSGVEIFEYQPQVLHAKTLVLDGVVYAGSSNLDPRSLRLNFELMLRIEDPALAATARAQFEADLAHSRPIHAGNSWQQWSAWTRLKQRMAHFILARLDPWFAREQLRRL